ncbi:MAG TPA: acetylglutamate kinase [Gammaproteobacteria bacterium]|jgi:acetylglutamate kinase|nr:acetylglutamate kinase [Gammaproteobacteria bacterium]HIK73048.1 acetylglutamate kinase [Gammaproteobacteria bacterium]
MGITRKQAENIASVLSEGMPYIQRFYGKIIVVKYGGAAMSDESLKNGFARDIALMKLVGMKPVIVHGGGPQIARELIKAGVISDFQSGHRITDKATMAVVKKVLGIQVNNEISSLISKSGAQSKGLNFKNSKIVRASKLINESGLDLGLVGQVDKINTREIKNLILQDIIPVISPIGLDRKSQYLNINADSVAGKVAESLRAEKLILLTDVKGITDKKGKLLSKISSAKANKILKNGIVKDGMVPKLIAAVEAAKSGVSSAHIIDGRVPHAVMLEILTKEGVGTLIS